MENMNIMEAEAEEEKVSGDMLGFWLKETRVK